MKGPFQGKGGYAYMMGNQSRSIIYTGVTADVEARAWQHKRGEGFASTKQYFCTDLLWYEAQGTIETAIARESEIKKLEAGMGGGAEERDQHRLERLGGRMVCPVGDAGARFRVKPGMTRPIKHKL